MVQRTYMSGSGRGDGIWTFRGPADAARSAADEMHQQLRREWRDGGKHERVLQDGTVEITVKQWSCE